MLDEMAVIGLEALEEIPDSNVRFCLKSLRSQFASMTKRLPLTGQFMVALPLAVLGKIVCPHRNSAPKTLESAFYGMGKIVTTP